MWKKNFRFSPSIVSRLLISAMASKLISVHMIGTSHPQNKTWEFKKVSKFFQSFALNAYINSSVIENPFPPIKFNIFNMFHLKKKLIHHPSLLRSVSLDLHFLFFFLSPCFVIETLFLSIDPLRSSSKNKFKAAWERERIEYDDTRQLT